jgi:RNA polymerase sigma-70 factor (ECF subfamily)
MTDEQAVELAKNGRQDAFRELYERHKTGVYAIACRYARSPQDAEDILQETFIKAFKAINGFGNSGNAYFGAWIHKICLHRCIDYLRKGKRRQADRTDSLSDYHSDLSTGDPSPERSADNRRLVNQVRQAFSVLSPRQKIIFDMKYFQNQEIPEIASALGCSEFAVKTHLSRAAAKLRKRIAPIQEEL